MKQLFLIIFSFLIVGNLLFGQNELKKDSVASTAYILKYPLPVNIFGPPYFYWSSGDFNYTANLEWRYSPKSTLTIIVGFMPETIRGHHLTNYLYLPYYHSIIKGSASQASLIWRRYFITRFKNKAIGPYFGGGIGVIGFYNTLNNNYSYNHYYPVSHFQMGVQFNYKRFFLDLPASLGYYYNFQNHSVFSTSFRFQLGFRISK